MNKCFVDTNLFIRYLTYDIPDKALLLRELIKKSLNDEIQLITNEIVIAEIVWTLRSFYKYSKENIDKALTPIVNSSAFEIANRQILIQALEDFHILNIDFTDAYIGAWMKENGLTDIYTLNVKDYERIPGIHVMPMPNQD